MANPAASASPTTAAAAIPTKNRRAPLPPETGPVRMRPVSGWVTAATAVVESISGRTERGSRARLLIAALCMPPEGAKGAIAAASSADAGIAPGDVLLQTAGDHRFEPGRDGGRDPGERLRSASG